MQKCGQGGTGGVDLRWLVADQLGTPRMVIDKTGSLAGVTRHDYLPFGEELPANVGWRASAPGYGVGDGVRQQFTGYEGDAETGLDYAQARYYAKGQGRFASADPLQASASAINPQSWNRYAYVGNNPLNSADPTGMDGVDDPGVQGTPANSQAQAQNCTPANPCEIVSDEELQRRGPSGSLLHETSSVTATANDPIENTPGVTAVSLMNSDPPKTDPPKQDNPFGGELQKNGADYVQLSISIPIEPDMILSISPAISIDRYGKGYFSIGPSIGKTWPFGIAGSIMNGYVDRQSLPSGPHQPDDLIRPDELETYMTGYSSNSMAGVFTLGEGIQYGPGGNGVLEGIMTPQIGTGTSFTKKIFDLRELVPAGKQN
jgi:RHS repeat-associated protein